MHVDVHPARGRYRRRARHFRAQAMKPEREGRPSNRGSHAGTVGCAMCRGLRVVLSAFRPIPCPRCANTLPEPPHMQERPA